MVLQNTESPNEAKIECNASLNEIKEEVKPYGIDVIVNEVTPISTAESLKKVEEFPKKTGINMIARLAIFIFCIIALVLGRLGVPDEEVSCVTDRVVNALQSVNDFINKPGNEFYRDLLQMICSFFMDTVFLTTFGYWVLKGKSARLPISLGIFYVVRALVQAVWVSPFPQGYYWEAPILPSLVVPYGRGSDFFFSGHSGFVVICASEWHKIMMPKMRNFCICVGIYTIFILLTYRIHYSIDVFTGVIFAEWVFGKVDLHKDTVASFFSQNFRKLGKLFKNKYDKMIYVDQVLSNDSPKEFKDVKDPKTVV